MLRLFCFALTALVVSACSNSGNQRGATVINSNTKSPFNFQPIPASAQQPGTLTGTATSVALNPPHGQPGHRCDVPDGAPLNTAPISTTVPATTTNMAPTTATSTATSTNLNPAHGQPGHRCDIAVGAPLNSAPITAATTNTASTTQPTTAVAKTTSTTKPGMNPPHGEPGHRCDISVGAPLNSAPTNTTTTTPASTTTPVTTTPSSVPSITQVLPSASTTTTTDKNIKLNPAHGQPGHDCSIAVGQPLKN